MSVSFEIAGGSIAGKAHQLAGRNNQDAFSWAISDHGIAAFVCDGCSSGFHSEVGAKIAAQLLANEMLRCMNLNLRVPELLECLRLSVLGHLCGLANAMGALPGEAQLVRTGPEVSKTICDHFLFTVLGILIQEEMTHLFSLGDGVFCLNGERLMLGPYPDNEPPYLAYALLSPKLQPMRTWSFEIQRTLSTTEVHTLLIGTDGASDIGFLSTQPSSPGKTFGDPLQTFWEDDRCFRNPDMVRRKLVMLSRNSHDRPLEDDTTIVVLRRKNEES